MTNVKTYFKFRDWYGKFYTSQDEIAAAARKGLICYTMDFTAYGTHYTFKTLSGEFIARFYKDANFGFSTQAYGIEIPANIINLLYY